MRELRANGATRGMREFSVWKNRGTRGVWLSAALLSSLLLFSCGGGGGSSFTPPPPKDTPPPQVVSLDTQPLTRLDKSTPLSLRLAPIQVRGSLPSSLQDGEPEAYRFYGYGVGSPRGKGVYAAHEAGITGKGVSIGVFDSNFNQYSFEHSDLPRSRIFFRVGRGLVEGSPDINSSSGVVNVRGGRGGYKHGLAVAGVIGAGRGGGKSVGVAPGVSFIITDVNSFSSGPPGAKDSDCDDPGDKTKNCRPLPTDTTYDSDPYVSHGINLAKQVYRRRSSAGIAVNLLAVFMKLDGELVNKDMVAINFSTAYLGARAYLWSDIARFCTRRLTGALRADGKKDSLCNTQPDIVGGKRGIQRMAEAFEKEAALLDPDGSLISSNFADLKRAIKLLGDKGVVSVVATGNYWAEETHAQGHKNSVPPVSNYPGLFAGDADVKDAILLVGALEGVGSDAATMRFWRRARYSNGCGDKFKERCLFAVVSRSWTDSSGVTHRVGMPVLELGSSQGDQKWRRSEGTSFAAPQVTGAIALLVERFKPGNVGYNGKRAAVDLLDTAILVERADKVINGVRVECPIGTVSIKCRKKEVNNVPVGAQILPTVTGNGRMDILSALNIFGRPSAPVTTLLSGASLPLEGSRLRSGRAFGDALERGRSALGEGIVVDELGRAFKGEFALRTTRVPAVKMEDLLFAPLPSSGERLRTTLATSDWGLSAGGGEYFSLYFSEAADGFSVADPSREGRGLFAATEFGASRLMEGVPEFSFAWNSGYWGEHHGDRDLSDGGDKGRGKRERVLWFGFSDSSLVRRADETAARFDGEPSSRRLLRFGGVEGIGGGVARMRWEYAALSEGERVLGGVNEGVLGMGGGSESRFVSFGLDGSLGGGWHGFADISHSSVEAVGGGILERWRGVRARGWSLGAGRDVRDLDGLESRIGVRLWQPLRAYRGELELEYPSRILADRVTVERGRGVVSLLPSGRERILEFVAGREVLRGVSFEGRAIFRHEAGHSAVASSEFGIVGGIALRF